MLPDAMEEIAKLVVVACDVVALSAVKVPKVLDALVRMPPERVASPVTPSVLERVALWRVARPLAVSVVNVAPLVALREPPMVEDAEEKKLVVVAPPLKVAAPAVVSVPVKLAEDDMVCPLIRPVTVSVPLCVVLPEVRVPKDAPVAKRLVDEAVVAKVLVLVACDDVELVAVKAPNVAPLVALSCDPMVVEPVVTSVLREESAETLSDVEVALVVVELVAVTFWSDVLPPTVSDPLALSAPPTVRVLESVVDPVTASVPVVVAPVVVSPPLKASCVVVAPLGNG